jgi:hypothetical protein
MGQSRNGVTSIDTTNNAFGDITQLDAFGRLRVSEVTTAVDLKMLASKREFWIDELVNGTAISNFDNNTSSVDMSTSTVDDYVIRQEYQRNRYQSGKSQQIFMTFSRMQPQPNIVKRVGYFQSNTVAPYDSDKDGLWIESSNDEITINIQSTGAVVESTAQADFNVDKMDGKGPSGHLVDWSKSQILFIDFEWLGVGRVRWGLVIDGVVVPMHYSNHANTGLDVPYMRSPNQPLRWEIRQTDAVGSGTMKQICATVGSEGGLNELGITRSAIGQEIPDGISCTAEVKTALVGIRMKDGFIDIPPDLSGFGSWTSDKTTYLWEIYLNPDVAGWTEPTWVDEPDSTVQVAKGVSGSTLTGGIRLIGGFSGEKASVNNVVQIARKLGISIDGVKDRYVVCVTPEVTKDFYGSIDWVEIG